MPAPDLDVVGLLQHTSALRPKGLQAQDQFLKGERIGFGESGMRRSARDSKLSFRSASTSCTFSQILTLSQIAQLSASLSADLLQHPRGHQLLLNVPLQNLHQELSQIRALLLGPCRSGKMFETGARNICAASARDSGDISDDASRLSSAHIKPSASA